MRPHRVVHAAVVRSGRTHRAGTRTDHQRRLHLAVAHVAQLRGLQHDLPGRLEQEVREHQVGHTTHAGGRGAKAGAGKTQLGDRRVDHTIGTELGEQALGMRKGAAAFTRAFAKIHDRRVAPHFFGQAVTHRIQPAGGDRDRVDLVGRRQRSRWVDRLRIDVPVYRGRVGLGRIAREFDRPRHLRLDPFFNLVELLRAGQRQTQQPLLAQHTDRVPFGPCIDLGLGAVTAHHGVALVVRHHAVGLDLDQRWAVAPARARRGRLHHLPNRQQIVPIHRNARNAIRRGTRRYLRIQGRLGQSRGGGIQIVLADEDGRCALHPGEVERLVERGMVGSTVPEKRHAYVVGAACPGAQAGAHGGWKAATYQAIGAEQAA